MVDVKDWNIVIPMAGAGKRFADAGYREPKPLIPIFGVPMVQRAVTSLGLNGRYIFIVRKYENETYNVSLQRQLESIVDDPIIITIDEMTEGASQTCLLAKEHINTDKPLVITNCDQIMHWNPYGFVEHCMRSNLYGVVATYKSNDPKCSYVYIGKRGIATRVVEKKVISDRALNGIHYWKMGSDFVWSAEKMIEEDNRTLGEFYVAPTYNYLIKGNKAVGEYQLQDGDHHPVGTPDDLKAYNEKYRGRYQ